MKKYDFDKVTDRRKFDTLKWDMPDGTLPMWVADINKVQTYRLILCMAF